MQALLPSTHRILKNILIKIGISTLSEKSEYLPLGSRHVCISVLQNCLEPSSSTFILSHAWDIRPCWPGDSVIHLL